MEEFKNKLKDFISSDKDSIKVDVKPIRVYESILKELGFNSLVLTGGETNGWAIDFWYHFTHDSYGEFVLSGSLHYGEYVLSKRQKEED